MVSTFRPAFVDYAILDPALLVLGVFMLVKGRRGTRGAPPAVSTPEER